MSDEPHLLDPSVDRCPECGSVNLDPVAEADGTEVHFLCTDCDRCWTVELGFVHRMNPQSCSGCPARPRCTAAYAADHPA